MKIVRMEKAKKTILDFILAVIIFTIVLSIFALSSCKHDIPVLPKDETIGNENPGGGTGGNGGGQNNCDPNIVYYQQQIQPLLISNCAMSGCHSSQDHQDGVDLTNYSSVMNDGDIRPGQDLDESDLYEVITETDLDKRMPPPPNQPLTSAQIDLIGQWIQQGAANNSCQNSCDTNNVTFSGKIQPMLQTYCVGCHSGASPGGGITLSNYAGVNVVATNGKLLGAVTHSPGFSPMPKGGNQLSTCQIDQIRIWINAGSPNN